MMYSQRAAGMRGKGRGEESGDLSGGWGMTDGGRAVNAT